MPASPERLSKASMAKTTTPVFEAANVFVVSIITMYDYYTIAEWSYNDRALT
jgi:hypothetical protein